MYNSNLIVCVGSDVSALGLPQRCVVVHPKISKCSLQSDWLLHYAAENTPGKLEEFFASTRGEYGLVT